MDEKLKALAQALDVPPSEIEETAYDTYEALGREYFIVTPEEAEARMLIVGAFHIIRIK